MHEHVKCPKCGSSFECQVGNISQCQCMAVKLTNEERLFLGESYSDCLCAKCMNDLKNEYYRIKQQEKLGRISVLFQKKEDTK